VTEVRAGLRGAGRGRDAAGVGSVGPAVLIAGAAHASVCTRARVALTAAVGDDAALASTGRGHRSRNAGRHHAAHVGRVDAADLICKAAAAVDELAALVRHPTTALEGARTGARLDLGLRRAGRFTAFGRDAAAAAALAAVRIADLSAVLRAVVGDAAAVRDEAALASAFGDWIEWGAGSGAAATGGRVAALAGGAAAPAGHAARTRRGGTRLAVDDLATTVTGLTAGSGARSRGRNGRAAGRVHALVALCAGATDLAIRAAAGLGRAIE